MKNVFLLPVRVENPQQAFRLGADLFAAHERGEDLGSRSMHIQTGGKRLLDLCRTLECVIEAAKKDSSEPLLQLFYQTAGFQQFISNIRSLADLAHCFPDDAY